jgi:hypothetical protein
LVLCVNFSIFCNTCFFLFLVILTFG